MEKSTEAMIEERTTNSCRDEEGKFNFEWDVLT